MGRPPPPHSALSAGEGTCSPLWGWRRSAGPPPPLRLSLFLFFLAVAAAVLTLLAVKTTAALTLVYLKVKTKTAVVSVFGGRGALLVRALAMGVLSVLVRRGVLALLPPRWGLLPPLLLLLPLLGGPGRWSSLAGVGVGGDLGLRGRLPLAGLRMRPRQCRLPCL